MADERPTSNKWKRMPIRYILALLGHCGILVAYAMRVNLSVGLVAMVNSSYVQEHSHRRNNSLDPECPGSFHNHTNLDLQVEVFDWDEDIQGTVLGAFFYGYLITQIPGGMAATHFGGKWVFGIGIFVTSALTVVTPLAARCSVNLLIAVRVIAGLGEGVTFPAMHAILAKWAPVYERTRLAALIYSGASFGTLIAYPISGILCNSKPLGGWPTVFYFFGSIGVLWFILWSFMVSSSPELHPRISSDELKYIIRHRGANNNNKPSVPWKRFITSGPVIGLFITTFCNNWIFYTFLTCLPLYFKEVLNFPIKENGLLSALPYLACFLFTLICGEISDYLRRNKKLSTGAVRKLFTSIATFTPAALLIGSGYIGCNRIVVAVVLLTFANGFLGCNNSGTAVNHLDIAPKFAGILQGITNSAGTVPGIFSPMVVGFLTEDEPTRGQWQKVFFIAAAVSFLGGLVFVVLASGKEQSWSAQVAIVDDDENVTEQTKPLI